MSGLMFCTRRKISARQRRGFTLIEACLATIIVGTGVLSMVQLMATCTGNNRAGLSMTTAMFLANNVQEVMADLPFNDPSGSNFGLEEVNDVRVFDDVDDFHGFNTFATAAAKPIDSTRVACAGMDRYAQSISVREVNPYSLNANSVGSDAKSITVNILYRGSAQDAPTVVYSTSWVRLRE